MATEKAKATAIAALVVSFGVCLYFAGDILGFLIRPLTAAFPPGQGRLVYTKLYEAFFVELKVALFAAFFVSFPVIANQLWAFIAPGLYAKEKKAFLPFLVGITQSNISIPRDIHSSIFQGVPTPIR